MIVQERSDSRTRLDGTRVVVVDDAPIIRRFLSAALEEFGAAVTVVETADAALEAVMRERPDVLISDLEMPGKGGHWLIGQVRALVSAVASLALCGREPSVRQPSCSLAAR